MPPQRDGSPPSEWKERRDEETRRAIERVKDDLREEFSAEIEQLRSDFGQRLEREHVTYKAFTVGIVAMLAAVFALATQYMSPVKETVSNTFQLVAQRLDKQDAKFQQYDVKLERQAASVEAVMRVTVDGKPRKQVQKEWETKTGIPRVDANP